MSNYNLFSNKIKAFEKDKYGNINEKNMIIHADNWEALKLLHHKYEEKVKCIYIDPPYNNGESYNHYEDNKSHKVWLDDIIETLKRLRPFLSKDGSIWISIDDNELHYLKVAADKIFGRENFITTIVWQQRKSRENRKVFSNNHEYILVYAKEQVEFKKFRNLLPPSDEMLKRYKNYDDDPRGPWQSVSAHVQAGHASENQFYEIIAPNGNKHTPPNGRCWAYNKERMEKEIEKNNIYFGKDGNGVPRIKKFLDLDNIGLTPETLWLADDVGTNNIAKKHILNLFPDKKVFDTPKPEKLIKRIIHIATDEDDLVLDAFLGTGTTTAVAHKMKRNYIGIEIGEHIHDFAIPRMKKVINGEMGGISKELDWKGDERGFKIYEIDIENQEISV